MGEKKDCFFFICVSWRLDSVADLKRVSHSDATGGKVGNLDTGIRDAPCATPAGKIA